MSGPRVRAVLGTRMPGVAGGVITGTSQPQAWVLEARRATRRYLHTTTFVSDRHIHRTDPLLDGILDAADECKHGNLPHNNRCQCWQLPTTKETT